MDLKLIKQNIESGFFGVARTALEQYQGIITEKSCGENDLPLLVMCVLISEPNVSFNLCSILIEKSDQNSRLN